MSVTSSLNTTGAHNPVVITVPVMPTDNLTYAGFGIRTLAILIDYAVMAALAILPVTARYVAVGPEETAWEHFAWVVVFSYPYFLIAQSSSWRCTIGKRVLGLKVSDLNGGGISFGRAHIRYLSKVVCFLVWFASIGTIGTTIRKQALHDLIAGTVVLRDAT